MLQSWSVDAGSLQNLETVFGDEMPEGGTELVLPVARMGAARLIPTSGGTLTLAADLDMAFDGQQANAINAGDVSFHPRLGAEYSYGGVVALRAGLARIRHVEGEGLDLTPTVGAGVSFRGISVDYGFGDFAGMVSELGYSHRISLAYRFGGESYRRPGSE